MSENPASTTFCPECIMDLPEGAVICMHCGYNLQTGQKISTVVEQAGAKKRPRRVGVPPRAQLRNKKGQPNPLIGIPANYEEADKLLRFTVLAGAVCGLMMLTLALSETAGFTRAAWSSAVLVLALTVGVHLKSRACAVCLLAYFVVLQIYNAATIPTLVLPSVIGLIVFTKFFVDGVRGTTTYARADRSIVRSTITTLIVLVALIGAAGSHIFQSAYDGGRESRIKYKQKRLGELREMAKSPLFMDNDPEKLSGIEFEIVVLEQEIEALRKQD